MRIEKTLKKTLITALFLTTGCSQPEPVEFQRTSRYVYENGEIADKIPDYKIPEGGQLGEKIELDSGVFGNRFSAHFYKEISDRVYVDLQESKIRNLSFAYDKWQQDLFVMQGIFANDNYAQMNKREFTDEFYKESRKIFVKALRNSLKDLEIYSYIKPFFAFDLKRDKIPFTNKNFSDVAGKEGTQTNTFSPKENTDDFDERIKNPQKVQIEQDLTLDWLENRVIDAEIGININFDIPTKINQINQFGIEPYFKWMDIIKWTYATKDKTIDHKVSFPVHGFGLGFSARTDEIVKDLQKVDVTVNYAINKNIIVGISAYHQFDNDKSDGKNTEDTGGGFGLFIKF